MIGPDESVVDDVSYRLECLHWGRLAGKLTGLATSHHPVPEQVQTMIVVMKPDARPEQIEHVIEKVEQIGMKVNPIYGTNRTVIACIGDKRDIAADAVKGVPGVEKVVPILAPFKMASLEVHEDRTLIGLGQCQLGGNRVGVIAGPCTVESRQQIVEVAHAVKEAGAVALRGGAFKPRTNPYSFQGLEEEGLKMLAEAREQTGLAVVTEVMSERHVRMVSDYADVLQVGARNMQNFLLLKEVGKSSRPVLLKRNFAATLEELMLAAEYIISSGNPNVILCERGIRTFEQFSRNTLSLAAVPALKGMTHLPVVVDPSHGTGRMDLVAPMAKAAVAAGVDGLILEVHPDPESAMVDGGQSLTPEAFSALMTDLRRVAEAVDRSI